MDEKIGDINEANSLGLGERRMLMLIQGPQKPLANPTENLEMANGCVVKKYVIPDADKAKVLAALYPFAPCPNLDEVRIDTLFTLESHPEIFRLESQWHTICRFE